MVLAGPRLVRRVPRVSPVRMTRTARTGDAAGPAARYRRPVTLRRLIDTWLIDVIVVGLFVVGQIEAQLNSDLHGNPVGLAIGVAGWTLPLLARRRFPFGAPATVIVVMAIEGAVSQGITNSGTSFIVVLLAVGLMGMNGITRKGVAGGALTLAAVGIVVSNDPQGAVSEYFSVSGVAAVAWVAGVVLHERLRRTAELEQRAARLERERESEARTAVAEERARIAREMHDVVAHSLSVMVVQAEAAEAMLDVEPERARRPLAAVQDTGRGALTELRRMLGALRETAGDGDAPLTPQPGLAGLGDLVDHVRAAGLPVELRVEGAARPLPSGVDLSAYRIVQEGLTNALKHAGPARAEVLVRYGDRDLELEVSDDGRGRDDASNGGGHGLVGMRERVALYGGELDAGPRPGGGFGLRARLPIGGAPA